MSRALRDRYGFLFWLKWILWFAGSFIVAAVFWTALMRFSFGRIEGPELTMTWAISVFGSWFLLVIPFMRKKEQIWKRLNDDQEKAVDAWLLGMGIFIGLLVASAFLWSLFLKSWIAASEGFDPLWVKAVFGSWLLVLIPFLVLMYRAADRIFKNAEARQAYAPKFRSVCLERSKRLLPEGVSAKVKTFAPTLRGGHVVTAVLRTGERVPHVFVINGCEILGVYDRNSLGFEGPDIVDIEEIQPAELPSYEESKWLRLDGKS